MPLASVQLISRVFPIEGADRIEGVEVLGWKCVVRKGIFKEGDLCIYIEIDTIIPKQLLDESYQGEEVVRLRTVKMKGQISQGLVLPLEYMIPPDEEDKYYITKGGRIHTIDNDYFTGLEYNEGKEVTEELRIKKYEKAIPANLQGLVKGNFPGFIPKTDEVRIQSEPRLLNLLKGKPYYITTKLDGTSATYYKFDGKFGVCSRNLELEDGDNIYWRMAKKYNIEDWLPDGFAIQGEIVGEGINKNPLGITGQELYLFNLFDIRNHKLLDDIPNFDDATVGVYGENVKFVSIEEMGDEFNYTLDELLERAKGNYPSGKRKEGIVVRSLDQTISFKVVNNDYLLKDEE